MLEWLLAPMDATRAHEISWHLSWHARIMVLAWGVLVPIGVVVARYLKIVPGQDWPRQLDSHLWWNTHRICQYSAFVLMCAGLYLIRSAPSVTALPGPHLFLGWCALSLACLQVLGGILRGSKGGPTEPHLHGDHYDMTPRRLVFEAVHKTVGYVAMGFAACAILSGVWQANGPNWMWLSLCLWWGALMVLSILLQRRGMAVDTYQAIWGPDPDLPGNKRKPIGMGITRKE